MQERSNLIRDSRFTRDLTILLKGRRRPLPLAEAARETLRIERATDERLRHIFGEMLREDPRFELTDDGIRLAEDERERLPLDDLDFVVLDTETTGCSPRTGDRLTEVAAVRVRNRRQVDRFSTLIDPQRSIPLAITHLTGISNAMVKGAPTFERAAPALLDFIGDAVVVAHNAAFDRGFLDAELRRAFDRCLTSPFLCTVLLSRRVVPGLRSYRLDSVASHLGVLVRDRHRALGDAEATAEILCHLLERLEPRGVRDLHSARRLPTGRAAAAAR